MKKYVARKREGRMVQNGRGEEWETCPTQTQRPFKTTEATISRIMHQFIDGRTQPS